MTEYQKRVIAAPLPAGTNNIGDVDVVSLPDSVIAGMTSLPAGTNTIGKLGSPTDGTYIGDIKFGEALPAGTNTIGIVKQDIHNTWGLFVATPDANTTYSSGGFDAAGKYFRFIACIWCTNQAVTFKSKVILYPGMDYQEHSSTNCSADAVTTITGVFVTGTIKFDVVTGATAPGEIGIRVAMLPIY